MSDQLETKQAKGRKFIVFQEIMVFGVLFIAGCAIDEKLLALISFAMVIVGAGVSYMGANAVKGLKK